MMKKLVLLCAFIFLLLQGLLSQLPLLFTPNSYPLPAITEGGFVSETEFNLRDGLPNVIAKMKRGEPVTVGFLGGSITHSQESYRNQTLQYLQKQFPNVELYGVNAGVPGTGTELGAFRLQEQILDYHPDLVFVEFAVNGGAANAIEGIVRQIIQNDPNTDICFIYTLLASQTSSYLLGNIPTNAKLYDAVANYYNLPSIHFGYRIAKMENDGLLVGKAAKGSVTDKIIFSYDGTHPTREGGNIYVQSIAYAWNEFTKNSIEKPHILPAKMALDNWELATMVKPGQGSILSSEWKSLPALSDARFTQYNSWFQNLTVCEQAGGSMTVKFVGDKIGLFDIGGPEAGIVELNIDGKSVKEYNRFNSNCNNRYRPQYFFTDMVWGEHIVEIKLSPKLSDKIAILGQNQLADITANPEKYAKHHLFVGRILIRGEIVHYETSLNDVKTNKISAYPNPVNDLLCINKVDYSGNPIKISVFDQSGKQQYPQFSNLEQKIQIDVSHFQRGIYFVSLENEQSTNTLKFLKQ
jgi:lysophospholipase L1-like esterase